MLSHGMLFPGGGCVSSLKRDRKFHCCTCAYIVLGNTYIYVDAIFMKCLKWPIEIISMVVIFVATRNVCIMDHKFFYIRGWESA